MNVELNQQEAQQLVNLIDAAVRAAGLTAAVTALPIVAKIEQSAKIERDNINLSVEK